MKNLVYLISFVILTLSWGCEKNEVPEEQEIIDPNAITPEMLYGDWTFVSLEFKGETYYECDNALKREYWITVLSFKGNDEKYFYPYTECNDTDRYWESIWTYELNGNILYMGDKTFKFRILSSVNEIKSGNLQLEFLWAESDNLPIGGIFTLQQ